jgi:hypothetical protein
VEYVTKIINYNMKTTEPYRKAANQLDENDTHGVFANNRMEAAVLRSRVQHHRSDQV